MYKRIRAVTFALAMVIFCMTNSVVTASDTVIPEVVIQENVTIEPVESPVVCVPKPVKTVKKDIKQTKPIATETPEEEDLLSSEEIELIALVTMAEAEGECELGKRLVIDTVLNRVDSKYFPDTVHGVIYQKHQFSSMWNGRVKRVKVTKEVCQLVREELVCRTNTEVAFFTAGKYGKYGRHMFPIGGHYFSSYD